MALNLIVRSFILLLLSVSLAEAKNIMSNQDNIPCTTVDVIQASTSKLDTALKIKDTYIAYSGTPVFQSNDLWWFVGVGDITANSSDEAIKIGKTFLNNVTIQVDKYATKVGNEYICNYGPGYIQARGKSLAV